MHARLRQYAVLVFVLTFLTLVTHASAATYVVTSIADSGAGTLREAIGLANANPGRDHIEFNITGPGAAPYSILLGSSLPTLTDSIVIDGYSQSGAAPNTNPASTGTNAVIQIEVDGASLLVGSAFVVDANSCEIRGLAIRGCPQSAVLIQPGNTSNHIHGNFIGTDASGLFAYGNLIGVKIDNAPGNLVGGDLPELRNLIVGGSTNDVDSCGVAIFGGSASDNLVWGNQIGQRADGHFGIGGLEIGVCIDGAPDNEVGGPGDVKRNYIANCTFYGVRVENQGATGNQIRNNFIGTDINGTVGIPNLIAGISLASSQSVVGGGDGEGNLIRYNLGFGVVVEAGSANTIQYNAILGNASASGSGLGIDLIGDGVTANDVLDPDTGPNGLQNFPEIASAAVSLGNQAQINGSLQSRPNTNYKIEIFRNTNCDGSGYGEGTSHVAFVNVTTDASGLASFTWNQALLLSISAGDYITATATSPNGSTSEFSECRVVDEAGLFFDWQVVYVGYSAGSLFEFAVNLTNLSTVDALNVSGEATNSTPWLDTLDGSVVYGSVSAGTTSNGGGDTYTLDLQNWPGGSFLLTLTITYEDQLAANADGVSAGMKTVRFDVLIDPTTVVGIDDARAPSASEILRQNYPNPFTSSTAIGFDLDRDSRVSLRVYDVAGRLVATVADEQRVAGAHLVEWNGQTLNGRPAPSGVYFYRLTANGHQQTRRMIRLK